MQAEILALRNEILAAIAAASTLDELEAIRIRFLSRQGSLPLLLEKLSTIPKEERPAVGKIANETRQAVQTAFTERTEALQVQKQAAEFDPTLPGRQPVYGSLHPILRVRDRALAIFKRLGFVLADGPDIENEVFNFDALNTLPDHPARNEQDTFYLDETGLAPSAGLRAPQLGGRRLLRTQTSTVQIRTMLAQQPPVLVTS